MEPDTLRVFTPVALIPTALYPLPGCWDRLWGWVFHPKTLNFRIEERWKATIFVVSLGGVGVIAGVCCLFIFVWHGDGGGSYFKKELRFMLLAAGGL